MFDEIKRSGGVAVGSLAAVLLAACGAHSFTLGTLGGTSTTSTSAGPPTSGPPTSGPPTSGPPTSGRVGNSSTNSNVGTSYGSPSSASTEVPVDESDPVTAGTIVANKGLAAPASYPPGTDTGGSYDQAYGPPGARRGPGYYEENAQRWTILAGFTIDDATRRAKATGYTGKIDVRPISDYRADCKLGTVCAVTPRRWQLNIESQMTLWVNPSVKISSPD